MMLKNVNPGILPYTPYYKGSFQLYKYLQVPYTQPLEQVYPE